MKDKSVVVVGPIVNHHSLYENMLLFLNQYFKSVTFISRKSIIQEFRNDNNLLKYVKFIYDDSRVDKVYKNNIDLINGHDIFITDEYNSAYLRMFNVKFLNKKKLIILHNINRWTALNKRIISKYFIDCFFRKRLFNQFDAIITMGPNIKTYYLSKQQKQIAFFFPFDEYTGNTNSTQKIENSNIIISVPGTISEKRRNYIELLKILQKYYSANKDSKIIFKFLGKINLGESQDLLEKINYINSKFGEKIFFWEKFISTNEFNAELEMSDLILSNIILEQNVKDITEVYGNSKESGISYIIYKYAKPAIVPIKQNILSGFESQLLLFNNYHEIFKILSKIEKDEIDLQLLKKEAKKNRESFNKLIDLEKKELLNYLLE